MVVRLDDHDAKRYLQNVLNSAAQRDTRLQQQATGVVLTVIRVIVVKGSFSAATILVAGAAEHGAVIVVIYVARLSRQGLVP
jgi:hypothetical protein